MPLDPSDAVRAFFRVRQAMGWLGLALPVLMIGGALALGEPLPAALSDFYHTPLRDVFVGILIALGVFLITYLGEREPAPLFSDRSVSTLAGLGAIGVAVFPNDTLDACSGLRMPEVNLAGVLHVASAGLFLGMAAVFCLVLFPRSDDRRPGPRKPWRNRLYRACGVAILAALALIGAYILALGPDQRCALAPLRPVLWLEIVTVAAFGLSWLVKGRGIEALNDAVPRALLAPPR